MRYTDWPERLAMAQIQIYPPFEYGVFDCCIFAGKMVEVMTGKNPMDEFKYSNKTEALRIIAGMDGLENGVSKLFPEVHPSRCQRGDLVLVDDENGNDALGVCLGAVYAIPGPHGLSHKPMSLARKAWHVE